MSTLPVDDTPKANEPDAEKRRIVPLEPRDIPVPVEPMNETDGADVVPSSSCSAPALVSVIAVVSVSALSAAPEAPVSHE